MIRLASGCDVSLTSTWRIVGALSLAAYVFLVVPAESAETTQVASIPSTTKTTETTATSSASQPADTASSSSTVQTAQASSAEQSQPADQQQLEKKPKQDTQTRATAFASSGGSAAGSIGGIRAPESIRVSSGGAATYSIPITVPPGTTGVAPKLAFTYNSQGENSLLGVGWSVSGLPIIHRCGATYAQDGFKGGVNYDANDRFCLDGARLMAISGTYGANGTEYRTEVDSFVKIISLGLPAAVPLTSKCG